MLVLLHCRYIPNRHARHPTIYGHLVIGHGERQATIGFLVYGSWHHTQACYGRLVTGDGPLEEAIFGTPVIGGRMWASTVA